MYAPTQHEFNALLEIIDRLNQAESSCEAREDISANLLELLHADHLASYVWNQEAGAFQECVARNISPAFLQSYDSYYQYRDPISPGMRLRRQATIVTDVISQRQLEQTEFFNDFLMAAGMHHGVDMHLFNDERHVGDLRIWRTRDRPEFSVREVALLEMLKPHLVSALRRQTALKRERVESAHMQQWQALWMNHPYPSFIVDVRRHEIGRNLSATRLMSQFTPEQNAELSALLRELQQGVSRAGLWNGFRITTSAASMPDGTVYLAQLVPSKAAAPSAAQLCELFGLTQREADVCALVLQGYTDKEISKALSISFPTVRTHMTHSFSKCGVTNRAELIHRIAIRGH